MDVKGFLTLKMAMVTPRAHHASVVKIEYEACKMVSPRRHALVGAEQQFNESDGSYNHWLSESWTYDRPA